MATLIIYMAKEDYIPLPGGMVTQGRETRILREGYDYTPKPTVEIGERLMCTAVVSPTVRRTIPTDWVVVDVVDYASTEPSGVDYAGIKLAFCEKKPLTLEEFNGLVEDIEIAQSYPVADQKDGDLAKDFWQ